MTEPRLLNVKEAAGLLRIQPQTLRRAAHAGRVVGAHRAGKAWRFDPDVLEVLPKGEHVPGHGRRPTSSPAARAITAARRRAA